MEFWGGLGFVSLPLKRFYMYILKRLIGGFLRHDIDLEQLDVQLYRGIVQLKSLELDVTQLNLAALGGGLLLHFASALIGCIKMDIPWRHLLRDHCKVYVSGVNLVLTRGSPEAADAGPGRPLGSSPPATAAPAAQSSAQSTAGAGQGEAAERGRYSEEGVETLSRLVKLVMSRMELCIHEASLSLQAPASERQLRARLASVVVFSEQPADGAEERAARVSGLSLAMVPARPPPAGPSAERPAAAAGELLLASTDAPAQEAAPPGELRLRRGRGLPTAAAGQRRGVHLDVELSLHAVRFVVAPEPWRALVELLAAMELAGAEAEAEHGEGQEGAPAEMSQSAGVQRPAMMVQSLVESSFPGNPSPIGFWHELYSLFEADSQLEDVAGHGEPMDAGGESEGEDISLDEDPTLLAAAEGQTAGPLVGCTVRVAVAHIAGLVALGGPLQGLGPQPWDVPLLPGPSRRAGGDHAQLCVEGWSASFEQRQAPGGAAPFPAATVLARSAVVHLHRRSRPIAAGSEPEAGGGPGDEGDSPAELEAERHAPEVFIIHSQTEEHAPERSGPCPAQMAASEMDPLFCSAYSRAPPETLAASRVARTPEPGSCRCSTAESLGELGSEDDSFLHSAASSVRSLGDSSELQGAQAHQRGAAAGASSDAAAASSSAGPEPRTAPQDRAGSAREAVAAAAARLRLAAAEEGRDEAEDGEDLEQIFFDRSRPIRDALLRRRRAAAEAPAAPAFDGGSASSSTASAAQGWQRLGQDFQSKRVLRLLPLERRDGQVCQDGEPALPLPPVGHPLWDGLRLVEGGRSTVPEAVGHQIYAEWVGLPPGGPQPSRPSLTLECQPIMVSLCADSVHMLTAGASWLGDLAAVPQPQPRGGPPAGWRQAFERASTRRLAPAFALVGLAPLVRAELALGDTQRGDACLVVDIVIPRLFGQPQSDRVGGVDRRPLAHHMARDQDYEESLRLDLDDLRVFLKCGLDGPSDSSTSASAGGGACSNAIPLLSVFHAEGKTPPSDARVSCSIFRHRLQGLEAVAAPLSRHPEESQQAPTTAEGAPSALSEWTKISEVQATTESRSSLVLQDLRHASHRLLRPSQGGRAESHRSSASVPPRLRDRGAREPQRVHGIEEALDAAISSGVGTHLLDTGPGSPVHDHPSRARQAARSSSVDAARAGEGPDRGGEERVQEAEVELEVSIPGTLQLKAHCSNLPFLQEALLTFTSRLGELALSQDEASWGFPGPAPGAEQPGAVVLAQLGCTLTLGSLCLRYLEDETEAADSSGAGCDQELQLRLAPVSCRLLRSSRSDYKVCCVGQDFRLEDRRAPGERPEPLVQPWFQPMLRSAPAEPFEQSTVGGAVSSSASPLSPSYPWEVRRARCLPNTVRRLLAEAGRGRWRESQSVLVWLEQRRLGGVERASVAVKANRLLVNGHHRLHPAYQRLLALLDRGSAGEGSPQQAPPGQLMSCQVALYDCLLDLPSRAYGGARSEEQPAAAEGEEWRAVVHLDGAELELLGAQGLKASLGEGNIFLVDRPGHLSSTEITSSLPRPAAHLAGLGFARVLGLSGASASWRREDAGPPAQGRQALEISVGELSGHVCADTVKCLLCVGMELAESLPAPAASRPDLEPQCGEESPSAAEELEVAELFRAEPAHPQVATDPSVSILENIDMFAFESDALGSAGSGSQPPGAGGQARQAAPSGELPLESVLIDDYIRAQEQQQAPRAPVRASLGGEGPAAALPPASVAVCLFDPEAYPSGHLRELAAQEQSALEEVERLFEQPAPPAESPPAAAAPPPPEAPAAARAPPPREVMHQDGSAAVWLVDPDEVQVVADHFVGHRLPRKEEAPVLLPAKAPPVQLLVTLQCRTAQLSLCAGADFDEDPRARPRPMATRQANHLTLQLQQSMASLMIFDTDAAPAGGPSHAQLRAESAPQRRYLICARDVSVLDHVQGSVFSNLLSYFEDERRRPRPSHADMLRLLVDEVAPPSEGETPRAEAAPEYRVELRLLPLQLTIDQDVVDFLVEFVQLCTLPTYVEEDPQELAGSSPRDGPEALAGPDRAPPVQVTAVAPPPALLVREPFFQHVSISPLLLSVDYRAKRLDVDALRRGELWELVNLLPLLEGLQIAFRGVTVTCTSGLSQLAAQAVSAWSADLNRTQILRSLTGVTPIRSFANIGGGFAEMVLEPLKQYRTGGGRQRISRTILRGLVSFLKHVTVESIDLTERIFVGTQTALEYMNACLHEHQQGPAGGGRASAAAEPGESPLQAWTAVERGASDFLQPGGAAEGLEHAAASLTRCVRQASEAVVVRPLLELHRGAPRNQVIRSVARGIPMCVLQPALGATAAAAAALRGVRNSVDPLHRREMVQKYKGPE